MIKITERGSRGFHQYGDPLPTAYGDKVEVYESFSRPTCGGPGTCGKDRRSSRCDWGNSGSTLIAARNLGRKAIGVEVEERYCEIIARRLDQGCFDFSTVVGSLDD